MSTPSSTQASAGETLLANDANPWWRTGHAVRGMVAGVVSFVCLLTAFAIHVHHDYEGKYHAPFLPAHKFGLPKAELDAGQRPVCGGDVDGWDGQFHYHISQDPFALDIEAFGKHICSMPYRYQRIGVPLMAWGATRVMGQSFVSPFLYHVLQIALTAVGFGVLVGWSSSVGLAWGWSLCWLLGGGVLCSLYKGLPDAPSDAMLAAALLALQARRLGWYSLFISLACLIREGYMLVAFVVFLATLVNRFSWSGSPGFVRRAFLTALPGGLIVGWLAYVSWAFEVSPSAARDKGLYGAPFQGFLRCLALAKQNMNVNEVRWSLVSVAVIVTVFASGAFSARRSLLGLCAAVYAILISSLGTTIWADVTGHVKAVTGLAIFGLMLLSVDSSPFRRGAVQLALVANLLVGLEINVIKPIVFPISFTETQAAQSQRESRATPPTGAQAETSSDCRSKIVWVNATTEHVFPVVRILRPFHRSTIPLTIDVTNESEIPWIGNRKDDGSIQIGVKLFREGILVAEIRATLPRDVLPGETVRVETGILARRPGEHVLHIGLLQEGRHWFKDRGQTDVVAPITVR